MIVLKKIWRFIKRWWWTVLIGAAAVGGALLWMLKPKVRRRNIDPAGLPPQRTFKEKAREEVERVRLEGEIEKVRVKATADVHREKLDEIEIIGRNDPAEGRRELANWLSSNL